MSSYIKGLFAEYFLMFLLLLRGYKILARRFKTARGEIDLIASKHNNMKVFEVKYRTGENFNFGSENVKYAQKRRIEDTLNIFLSKNEKYVDYNISYNIFVYKNIVNYKFFE